MLVTFGVSSCAARPDVPESPPKSLEPTKITSPAGSLPDIPFSGETTITGTVISGGDQLNFELEFHAGEILIGDYIIIYGSYDEEANRLTVKDHGAKFSRIQCYRMVLGGVFIKKQGFSHYCLRSQFAKIFTDNLYQKFIINLNRNG